MGRTLSLLPWVVLLGCPVPNDLTCGDEEWVREHDFVALPQDGATEVPRNTKFWLRGDEYNVELELLGSEGTLPLTYSGVLHGEATGRIDRFAAADSLEPNATYELRSNLGTISVFTTASEEQAARPPPPAVLEVETETILDPWNPDCADELHHLTVTVAQSSGFVLLLPRTFEDPFEASPRVRWGFDFTQGSTLESYVALSSPYLVSVDLAGNYSDWVNLGELEYPPLEAAGGCSHPGVGDPPALGLLCILSLMLTTSRALRPSRRGLR
jgi:hypothetical protein